MSLSFIQIKCAKDKWVKERSQTNSRAIPWKCYKKKQNRIRVTINTTNINQKVETNTQQLQKKNKQQHFLLISKSFFFLISVWQQAKKTSLFNCEMNKTTDTLLDFVAVRLIAEWVSLVFFILYFFILLSSGCEFFFFGDFNGQWHSHNKNGVFLTIIKINKTITICCVMCGICIDILYYL